MPIRSVCVLAFKEPSRSTDICFDIPLRLQLTVHGSVPHIGIYNDRLVELVREATLVWRGGLRRLKELSAKHRGLSIIYGSGDVLHAPGVEILEDEESSFFVADVQKCASHVHQMKCNDLPGWYSRGEGSLKNFLEDHGLVYTVRIEEERHLLEYFVLTTTLYFAVKQPGTLASKMREVWGRFERVAMT